MSRDYGTRKRSKGHGLLLGVIALAAVAAAAGYLWWNHRSAQIAEARHWTVQGPPCAPVSEADFKARGGPTPQAMDFEGVGFAREYGHVSCAGIQDHGGTGSGRLLVCQFSAPRALVVRTAKGPFYFIIDGGKPVSITIDHDQPSCVIGTTEWDRMGT